MGKKLSLDDINLDDYEIDREEIEKSKKKKKKLSLDDIDLNDYDFGIDEDYINSFLKDSQSYLKSQGNRTNSYKSGITAYDDYINSDTRKDLDARASNIKAYLNANKGNLDSNAYQSTISYITDYNSANRSLADSYSKAKNYYSQWKTEDDYNFSVNNNNNTLKYSKMSLTDLRKEKEDYDKTKKAVNFSKYSKALAPSGNPQGEAISNLILDFMDKKNSNKADSSPQEKWNKEYKDKAVLYYDSKGNAVTYDDLIREKEHTQIAEEINGDTTKLSAYVNAQEAQKKILELNKKYNELETQKMAYQTNGFVPDAIIAEQQSVSDAINQQKAIIEDFNSFGYDFDEIQYYNQMKEDREAEVKKAEEAQKYAEEHEIKATFKSMLSTPMMIGEYVKNLVDTAQYGYANVYDDKYTNQSQVYQSTVSNIIEDAVTNTTNSEFAGWLASTAYSGVTSATQSAMIGAVGTVLSGGNVAVGTGAALSIMGTQAAASSFNTSVKNGSTSGEAIAFSLASGIGEAVFEKLPLDNIFKLAKGAGKTATKEGIATLIKGLAKQSAIEGLEEGGTELWNAMADAIINGDHSAYNIAVDKYMKQGYSETDAKKMASTDWVKEVVSSMVGGFIGGGVTGGAVGVPSFAINQGIQNAQYDALGKSTIQNENVQGLVADAQSLVTEGEKSALNKLANKVAGVENVDNLSERQTKKYTRNVGKLVDEVANTKVKSIEAAQSEAIKHELESNGVEDVSRATDIVIKKMSGQSLTSAETEVFEAVDGNTIIDSVKKHEVKNAVDKDNLKRTEEAFKKTGELVFSKNKSAQHREMVEESGYTTTEGKTTVDATGVEVDSMIIDSLDGDDISLKVNMGENSEIVLAGELTLNDNYAVMLEGLKRIGKKFNMNTSSANKLLALYEAYNGDAFTFYKAMEAGISYGHYNIREYFDNNKFVADLPEAIREKLYEVGRENAQKTAEDKQALVELEGKAKAESKVSFAEGVKYNKLNKHQKAQVDFAQVIANTFGFDLEIFRSPKDASGRSLGENGSYSANANLMRLDIDAGTIDGKSLLLFTQSHELTHYIQKWSPEKYKVFADFLMEKYAKSDVPVQKLIEQKIEESKISATMDKSGKHHVLTESEAFDEIVANACEDFLADPNIQQTINMIAEIDQSIAQKIKNFIKNLVARLEKALHGLQGQSAEAQFVRELDLDAIEELKDLWTEALLDARENVLVARENDVREEESHTIAGIDYDQLEGAKNENGDELFQYRAIQHDVPEYRAMLEKYSDMSSKQIDSLFDTMNKAFEVIEDNIEILDYAWEENLNEDGTWDDTVDARAFNPVKANSDKLYKYSLDFSTMCRKRLLQQVIAEELSLALDRAVTKAESIAIRDELIKLQEEGRQIEIACALCYVESARMKSPVQIQKFLDDAGQKTREFFAAKAKGDVVAAEEKARKELAKKYAKEIKEGKITSPLETYTTRSGKTKFVALTKLPSNIAWEIRNAKRDAKANYTPTAEEQELIEVADKLPTATFTTAEGLEKLAKEYPVLFDVYTSFVRNATHSKGTEKDVWYRVGDVNKIGDDLIAAMNKENGLRSQSWSDFQVIHLLDYVGAIIELSTKKAKMQAYTKVPDYVNLMGLTGQMINLSLIPSREFSGKLDFDSVEGMAFKIALELRDKYPDVAGTISIGIANEQIQMLLDSADIDYVIPYHHSAMSKVVRKAMHIPSWVSYEAYQGEKKITSKKDALENAKKHGVKLLDASDANYHNAPNFSEWFDLEVARKTAKLENLKPTDAKAQKKYGVMYGAYKAMQEAADKYLELCAERGLVPKFCHANVDFTVEDNYWKLLIDRKMINQKTGEIIEQKPVQPIFNEGEVLDILNNEIARYEGVKEDFDYASRYVTERFLNGDMNEHITEIAKGIGETVNNVTKVAIVNSDEQFQDRNYAPTFYSQMGRVIESVKQEKLGAASVIPMLKGKGIKNEEIKWSGIEAFLEGKKSVTKQELLDFVAGSQLQIIEQVSGEDIDLRYDSSKQAYNLYDSDGKVIDTFTYNEFIGGYVADSDEAIYSNSVELEEALRNAYGMSSAPKWAEYKLNGGSNYRELLFKMPDSDYSNQAMKTHWGEDNTGVLAHARIQDFMVDGKKMLFIEEIQSDWHNEGTKEGYADLNKASALNKKYNEIKQRIKTDKQYVLEELAKHMVGRVDNPENASKSFIDFAYQNDKLFRKYVEKYDVPIELVNKIDSLRKNREESMKINAEIYNLENGIPDAPFRNTYHEYVLKRLIRMATEEGYDSIGWTPADVQSKRYSDEFAEAYRIEYDQDIPKFLNKYGKKWGAKVGTSVVSDGTEVWSMDITDSMKDSVLYDGQTMFQDRYIRYGKLTQNRIDYLIKDSGAGSRVDYANKWIASISPSDFIDLTLRYETRIKGREVFDTKVGGDYGSVMGDRDYIHEIRHNRELPYLMVDMETGKVLGHNGRHRMRALEMAGASRTPIGIIFYKDGYVYKGDDNGERLESIDVQRLTSQFDDKSYLQHNAYIHNIIPLNEDHRKEIEGTYRADKFEVEHFDVLAYQDRVYRPTFEDLGIERENVKLKADVENLKEMLKLQSTVTHGKVLAKAKYKDVAKKLLHDFGMKQVRDEDLLNGFVKRLDEYFSGIINSDELTWEFVMEGAYKVAKWVDYEMPTETKPKYEYAEEVLKDIRGKGVVLDDLQKAEVAYHYGSYNAFRRSLFGNINFVNKGTSLDSQWQEWSSNYPHIFDAETTTNDMPVELAKIIGNMKETEAVLNEEEQMQRVEWMAEQIYDAYWLMPTVKTLADKHQLEVNLLKGKHREQMDALRESHKAKELKTKEHFEEMLKKVKEHKDAQLEAYKEHVNEVKVNERERKNRTVMKNRIKGVVKELNSILSKGSKERNVKIPIQPAVMKALELAEYLFDDDLSNNFILTQANIEIREEEMADVEKYRYWNNIKEEHMKNMLSLMDKEGTESQVANLKDTISGVERKMGYLEKKLSSLITNEKKKLQQDGVGKAVKALAEAYSQLKNSEEDYVKEAYNEGVYNYIDGLANRLEGAKVKEMSESQMFDVYTAFKAVLTTVRDANKLFINGKREDVQKMSSAIMMQISGNKKTKTVPYEKLDTLKSKMLQYSWNELKPYYAFQRLGSSTLMKLYEAARQGEDVLGRDYQEAITFAERVKQKYGYDSWDMNKRYDIKLKDGREFTITLQEIMSIYAYSKREQAYDHMMFGGFVFNDKKFFKANEGVVKGALKPKTYRATDAEAYKLTLEDLAEIGNIINKVKGLKGFVDEMQGYLSTDMAAKGNEISRVLYGVDWFNEKNYFPIKSSRDFLAIVNNPSENYSLRNSGMTKTTVPHAKNPLVLEDFMTVWAEHVGKMSTYHSLVIPIDNLNKVLGYKEASTSMKTVLDSVFGKSAKEYLDNFLKDLNGGVSSQGAKSPVASMFGKFKKTAVAASTSVVVQQPTAILRAMAEIDGKYFVGASDKLKHSEKWELIKKYAPVAVIKELGGFDIGSGRRLETILTMPSYEGKDKVKGFFTDSTYRNESLDNAFMWGASKADEIGWNIIWSAVEREVKATSNLKYGTEEFYQKVGERFTEVVHKTQVYDSTFTRSGFQRSKSDLVQMSMSFMGEPTTSFNMLYDAVLQSSRNKISKGKATRIIGATVASIIMASVMKSFIYALRDDDEDESYLEKYMESTTENLVSDLFIPNMLPFVKDITSILSGWNVERTDFAIFTDIYESVTQLSSDTVSGYRKVEDLIGSIASLFGVPAKNLLRTGREIYNVAKNIFDNNVPYAQGVADAVKRGLPFTKEKSKSDKLYEAKTEGQQQVIDRYEGENIDNSLKKGLRDNDKRILKGVDALLDSDYTKYGSIIDQIASEGKFSKEVVSSAIQTEANYFGGKIEEGAEALRDGEDKAYKDVVKELRDRYRGIYTQDEIIKMIKSYEFKAEEESDEEKSIYKMKYVEDALASGNTQAATEMIEEIVATKVANGKTEEEARKSVRSSLTSYWKPLYEQALADDDSYEQNDIRDSLYDMGVYGSDEEIDETLHGWKQGYVLETYKPQYIEAYQNGDKAEMRRIENKVNSLGVYKNAYKTVRGWVD